MADQHSFDVPVTFECPRCNSGLIRVEDENDPASVVTCGNSECGVRFDQTWGEIVGGAKQRILDEIIRKARG